MPSLVLVWLFFLSPPAAAQDLSVSGRIVDSQGGVVVNAAILLEGASGSSRTASSGSEGRFSIAAVAPGMYVLRVRAEGFAESVQPVSVSIAPASVEVTLAVAGIGESIEVSAGTRTSVESRVTAASRLPMTSLETPASVQALSGEVIRERGDRTVEDAETRMVGVTTQGSLGNGGGSRMSRGFGGPNSIIRLYDGTQILVGQGTMTFPFDSWTVERVEYLAGPASVLYGSGAIGGALNVVPRRPSRGATVGQGRFTVGSFETVRAAGGVGGPINDRVAYRADLSHNRSAGTVERGDWNTTAASGSLGIQASSKLYVTIANDFGYQEPFNYWGSPFINGTLDRSLRDVNYNVLDGITKYRDNWSQVKADWQASSNVFVRMNVSGVNTRRQWRNAEQYSYQPATGLVSRSSYTEIIQYLRQYGANTEAIIDTQVFGRPNIVSLGFDYSWFRYQRDRNAGTATSVVALTNPTPGLFFNTIPTTPEYRAFQNRYATYAESRLALTDQLSVVGGLRWDRYDLDREDLRTAGVTSKMFNPVNGRGGLVYAVKPTLSVYGQYATASDPVNTLISLSPAEQAFDLTPGRQVEAGVKQSLWSGRGEWTLAAYRIVKEKLLVPDPLDSLRRLQVGQQSSRGIELSGAVALGATVRIDANMAALQARYDDFTENVGGVLTSWSGKTPTNIPARTANLWVVWSPLPQWHFQSGVRYVGDRFLDNANTTTTPSVTLVDAGARRRIGSNFAVDVRVANVFDKFYTQGASGVPLPVRGRYGPPRTVELTLDAKF
ncbi:MAG: TonB-dependent receptor plug domain-containing protein [Luteitalea sp.]|nr:TonB-dependent receptor plug domain-containing protein [Luteitalea sp.]